MLLSVRPSVRPPVVNRACEVCTKNTKPINVKIQDSVNGTIKVDYRMQYYDVITNPRWRTATNMKHVVDVIISVKNDPIIWWNLVHWIIWRLRWKRF